MNSPAMLEAWETRKTAYANQWAVGLCGAPCADLPCCCISMLCSTCASYSLRKRVLYGDLTRYTCCGGFMPCSGRLGERNCPEICLCLEVCICFGTSVAVTRWILQDELRIRNGQCDNCILATMICFQQLACICQLAACITGDDTLQSLADIISLIADVLWCSVCACVQTQHKIQMDERDRQGGGGNYGAAIQPPPQQYPPTYTPGQAPYAPQGQVGYPPAGGYPPGAYSYQQQPAQGYPGGGYGGYQQPPPGYPSAQPPMYAQQMYK